MSYYHTYRPQQFSDLVGQDAIRQMLQTAVATDKIVHAYLFCGTRGTGKTTTARLLAKLVNCTEPVVDKKTKLSEPCNKCQSCLAIMASNCMDVIEIDAASNRGIEEIRLLQEQVRFKPQSSKMKIFIIDEVHMLTKEAFNALLKTLEEPPAHLLFILATTESHKVPATILSRCQRYNFSTPSAEAIVAYLERIAQAEKLKTEPDGLRAIAELAHGSFRDSSTILEQLATSEEPISHQLVLETLGLPNQELVEQYLQALTGQVPASLSTDIQAYFDSGGNPAAFIDAAFDMLERKLKQGQLTGFASTVLSQLVRVKYQLKYSPIASLPILVALQSAGHMGSVVAQPATAKVMPNIPAAQMSVADKISAPKIETKVVEKVVEKTEPPVIMSEAEVAEVPTVTVEVAEQVAPVILPANGDLTEVWNKILVELLEGGQSSMVSILRTARPISWESPVFLIAVQFQFHADQLGRQKNRAILESTLSKHLGGAVRMEAIVQAAEDLASAAESLSF